MTKRSDYEPSQEDLDRYDELHGSLKSNGAGTWSSPDRTPEKSEPALSDAEIEERQRLRCIAELLTGRYDRPIPSELESLTRPSEACLRSPQAEDVTQYDGSAALGRRSIVLMHLPELEIVDYGIKSLTTIAQAI